jgi:hypothetical protein
VSGTLAHVGPNLPHDLLRATGRHAGVLAFNPDAPTPRADEWLESKFAPWTRSILQSWVDGRYDQLGQVLFSRADDSAQRLYYYVCELQRRGLLAGPEPLILDIAKVPRASSAERTIDAVRALGARLGVTADDLAASIAVGDRERARPAPSLAGRVCLLAGSPPPDRRLHEAIAAAGFAACGPTLGEAWSELGPVVGAADDPFASLGAQLHALERGPRAFADAGASLEREVMETSARAVVLWQIEEDEAQAWHLPAQRAALARAGIPALVLTRRDWLARDGAGDEISAFLQGIEP